MLFSRLQVSPVVTVLNEVSPRLLFNVHGYRSGHMQAMKIYFSNLCLKDMTSSDLIDHERRRQDLDFLLYFYKSETRKCCNEIT